MSLNDKDYTLRPGASNDVWPGSANPTSANMGGDIKAANFVDDPERHDAGAGAGPNFIGDKMAHKALHGEAGVIESRPGIIETTNIDPLNENSNKDDGWANATVAPGAAATTSEIESSTGGLTGSASSIANATATVATGAVKVAYGTVTGNAQMVEEGKAAVFASETEKGAADKLYKGRD